MVPYAWIDEGKWKTAAKASVWQSAHSLGFEKGGEPSWFALPLLRIVCATVCLLCGFLGNEANAAVISIPDDAPTIESAIEIANSGDTIIVYSEEVNWLAPSKAGGVHISSKDLIIMGADPDNPVRINTEQSVGLFNTYLETSPLPPSPDTSMLLLEESDLVLMNLRLDKPLRVLQPVPSGVIVYDSPLHVVSGSLRMENCVWAGTVNVRGNLSLI